MGKIYSRQIFKVNEGLSILCECEDTRSGFRHVASILRGGRGGDWVKPVKICYLNRTWESFEFQSVLHKLADVGQGLSDEERFIIRGLK